MDAFNVILVEVGDGSLRKKMLLEGFGVKATVKMPDDRLSGGVWPMFPLLDDCWQGNAFNYDASNGVDDLRVTGIGARKDPVAQATKTGRIGWMNSSHAAIGSSTNAYKLKPRRFIGKNEDYKLEGVLTIPPESVAKPPYKLLVYPARRPAWPLDPRLQLHRRNSSPPTATLVFQPNFRGSTGYGQEIPRCRPRRFRRRRHARHPHRHRPAREGRQLADPKRQFVYGTSYGGFMTTWLVGHTNQFKAAVAQNAVTDLNAMWGLSDHSELDEWEFSGKPWEQPAAMRKHSPLTYAADRRRRR